MKNFKPYFRLSKQERSGVFFLLLVIILLQSAYFVLKFYPGNQNGDGFSLNEDIQAQIDTLRKIKIDDDTAAYYPFNPNFISDHKGYVLGMSPEEIDRLHQFRAQDKFVNNAKDFQKVTGVSDTLLKAISPYFKFPAWTQTKTEESPRINKSRFEIDQTTDDPTSVSSINAVKDLNAATAHDLRKIKGIGEILSMRIVKFRDRLGGFLVDEQLYDVYGLKPDVVEKALAEFKVLKRPEIRPININTASIGELSKLVYIPEWVAERIVNYREVNGTIDSFDELRNIEEFPSEKIERIALYLSL